MATSKNKKSIPASDSRYKNMTPAQRNANTLKNIKESFAGPQKKTETKKPADTKKPVTVNNAKGKVTTNPDGTVEVKNKKGKTFTDTTGQKYVSNKKGTTTTNSEGTTINYSKKGYTAKYPIGNVVVMDKKGKTETSSKGTTVKNKSGYKFTSKDGTVTTKNSKGTQIKNKDGSITTKNSKGITTTPPAKKTTPASNNTSIEQKAKDVMSGKYGTGAARKTALGADYDKVQAIINKKATATKAKPTGPSKGTVATMQKNIKDEQEGRLKFDEPVASVSTKSTEVKPEVKPTAADVDKSIDAAMKGIAKSKIMKKGGTVKMKYGGSMKTKKR